jgi:hypothetical protein
MKVEQSIAGLLCINHRPFYLLYLFASPKSGNKRKYIDKVIYEYIFIIQVLSEVAI